MGIDEEKEMIVAAQNGDESAAEVLYEAYLPLIKRAAAIVNKRGFFALYDDAASVARLAFWRSVVEYDAQRGANFAAYVKLRVVGAVKDFLRAERTNAVVFAECEQNSAEGSVGIEDFFVELPEFDEREQKIFDLLQAGYKEREIARMVCRTQQAVSKVKMRLRRKLREHFSCKFLTRRL